MENYQDVTVSALSAIPHWKRLAFMAASCERMIPNFRRFLEENGVGDISLLRSALDRVWSIVAEGAGNVALFPSAANVEAQAPDPADFSSIYASAALDAVAAVSLTLNSSMQLVDATRAMEVAQLGRDTADLFVQRALDLDPNAPSFESDVLMSTPMQRELNAQRLDLEWLASIPDDASARNAAISRWAGREQSSLDPDVGAPS